MMVKERIKYKQVFEKLVTYLKENNDKVKKRMIIAMVAIIVIIAIILVNAILVDKNKSQKEHELYVSNTKSIAIAPCSDYKLYKFIVDYLKARTDLNYPRIFSSYGRDYYKEKREDKGDEFKKTIDAIRYERTFVRGYDDVKVYTAKGFRNDETICIVLYDLLLGFTDDKAPTIVLFYIKKDGDQFVIKNNLDVGTSKYIMDVINLPLVKELYDDTKTKLTRVLSSNESLKLAYNSLRQYEMNINEDINYSKKSLIDNFGIEKLDLVKDAEVIYKYITAKKKNDDKEKKMQEYLDNASSKLTNTQRAYLHAIEQKVS